MISESAEVDSEVWFQDHEDPCVQEKEASRVIIIREARAVDKAGVHGMEVPLICMCLAKVHPKCGRKSNF